MATKHLLIEGCKEEGGELGVGLRFNVGFRDGQLNAQTLGGGGEIYFFTPHSVNEH